MSCNGKVQFKFKRTYIASRWENKENLYYGYFQDKSKLIQSKQNPLLVSNNGKGFRGKFGQN